MLFQETLSNFYCIKQAFTSFVPYDNRASRWGTFSRSNRCFYGILYDHKLANYIFSWNWGINSPDCMFQTQITIVFYYLKAFALYLLLLLLYSVKLLHVKQSHHLACRQLWFRSTCTQKLCACWTESTSPMVELCLNIRQPWPYDGFKNATFSRFGNRSETLQNISNTISSIKK